MSCLILQTYGIPWHPSPILNDPMLIQFPSNSGSKMQDAPVPPPPPSLPRSSSSNDPNDPHAWPRHRDGLGVPEVRWKIMVRILKISRRFHDSVRKDWEHYVNDGFSIRIRVIISKVSLIIYSHCSRSAAFCCVLLRSAALCCVAREQQPVLHWGTVSGSLLELCPRNIEKPNGNTMS